MQELATVVRHPLFLLLTGALISGLVVPRLAQRWQDHRKALEIKAALVERLAGSVVALLTAVQFVEVGAQSQSQKDLDDAYRTWQKDKTVLTALLAAYFASGPVAESWTRCRAITTAYYTQVGIADPDRRAGYLRTVGAGVVLHPAEDRSEEATTTWASDSDVEDLSDTRRIRDRLRRHLDETIRLVNAERIDFGARRPADRRTAVRPPAPPT